jgi:hypothetical protein
MRPFSEESTETTIFIKKHVVPSEFMNVFIALKNVWGSEFFLRSGHLDSKK